MCLFNGWYGAEPGGVREGKAFKMKGFGEENEEAKPDHFGSTL
jgi:hypothetical protein